MKERHVELILGGVSLALISQILLGAFSKRTRGVIYDRARKRFGRLASEKSGKYDEPLECAHINHDPNNPKYDDPSNGRLLTLSEHLADHENRAGRNGLLPKENDWAIQEQRRKLKTFKESGFNYN